MNRISKFKTILWTFLGFSLAVIITRFVFGLGATTNQSDITPWAFWKGLNVLSGIALAGGGFTIAGFYYIFHRDEFHSITRTAVLAAMLGYLTAGIGIIFELGLPWRIWSPIIYWNPHSPLFEVAWCVMIYLTVLVLEFAPVVLEKYPKIKVLKILNKILGHKIKIFLVILGIMLSTLHQSSLGSLFLAMPYRLHPLWYSPIISINFFILAICFGVMMLIFINGFTHYLYNKTADLDIQIRLSKIALVMLIIYGLVRFGDILIRGAGVFLFDGSWGCWIFWSEIILSLIIPLIIFSVNKFRKNNSWLFAGALIGIIGLVFNHINVGGLVQINNLGKIGSFYFPTWMEATISFGIITALIIIFLFFIENYYVWDKLPIDKRKEFENKPVFDIHKTYLGPAKIRNRIIFSLTFVLGFSIAFALIPSERIHNKGLERIPATKARGGDTLFIDGNKDGYGVVFPHKFHTEKFNCGTCHHMNKPKDKTTGCYECHSEMYTKSDAFRHDWHASSIGGNLKCFDCHSPKLSKSKKTAKKCDECHKDLISPYADSSLKNIKTYVTVSYVDAMHKMCINCHESKIKSDSLLAKQKPNLAKCKNCHKNVEEYKYTKKMFQRRKVNKWVVIPGKLQ